MLNQRFIIAGFILTALVQLFVPANMIWQEESVITKGTAFHFKVAPVDPSDPFRGKYIRLDVEANKATVLGDSIWRARDEVYVSIEKGEDGFAKIQTISLTPPLDTDHFIKAEMSRWRKLGDSTIITINYPFDRYYMEESKAYPAEKVYRESARDSSKNTYGVVYIKKGKATLTDIKINDLSIQEVVKRQQAKLDSE